MLRILPENKAKFRNIMDAMHKIYETKEAKNEIPELWGLEDAMVRRGSFLVQCENLIGIVYDNQFPHTRKTLKARHEWEDFEWTPALGTIEP